MGNSLPFASPPKPSPTRAIIFMEPQCVRSYLREPWRRPAGKLQISGDADELPPALDGVIPLNDFEQVMSSVDDRGGTFKGGTIHIGIALFQACVLLAIILGFFISKYILKGMAFFNPITLAVIGALEFGVLFWFGRLFKREETNLKRELLELVHPWREQYGVAAKFRKVRGMVGADREGKDSSIFYCLILDVIGLGHDVDTASMSTFTGGESDVESQT